MHEPASDLEALIAAVAAGGKYSSVTPALIANIGARELAKGRRLKDAIKATKNKLHQVAGAYFAARPDYADWHARIARAADADARRAVVLDLMRSHASARERLPTIARFYAETLASIAPVRSVIDLACGLNPLAIPFMPLTADATYHAYDVYDDLAAFLGEALPLLGVRATAETIDLTAAIPQRTAQVALIVKALPCLEQLDATVSARLLEDVRAEHLLVSYPARSLGGAEKGMRAAYAANFESLIAGRGWRVTRSDFPDELAFLVTKSPPLAET